MLITQKRRQRLDVKLDSPDQVNCRFHCFFSGYRIGGKVRTQAVDIQQDVRITAEKLRRFRATHFRAEFTVAGEPALTDPIFNPGHTPAGGAAPCFPASMGNNRSPGYRFWATSVPAYCVPKFRSGGCTTILGSIAASPSGAVGFCGDRCILPDGIVHSEFHSPGNLPKSPPCAVHGEENLPKLLGSKGVAGPDWQSTTGPALSKTAKTQNRIVRLQQKPDAQKHSTGAKNRAFACAKISLHRDTMEQEKESVLADRSANRCASTTPAREFS
jgi:hypothetical protein